ncbi:MAG: ATP-binding protein [Spirulina sp.]
MIQNHLGRQLSNLTVGQKIGLGQALALGIAISGTIAGFGIGHYYQQQAEEREEHSRNEVALLHKLQSNLLQTRTHQQQLIPLARDREKFQAEYAGLLEHKAEIHIQWAELKEFIATTSSSYQAHVHQIAIPTFLETYQRVPQRYAHDLEHRVFLILNRNPELPVDVERSQALLSEFTNSDVALEFDRISEDLAALIEDASREVDKAIQFKRQVDEVTWKIVVASIGLSVAIAILSAISTSRAIARPLQALTRVAQQSTEESNFALQATVEQEDEIGTLAKAFNQLIRSVQQLLQQQKDANKQLEAYNHTLESKVEERTQELNEKNTQLQQLLEELKRTQVQMVQSEKMSALGQMVAGVAHEINNPVNFIHGNLVHVQNYADNLLSFIQLYEKLYPNPSPEIDTEAEALDIEFIQEDLPNILNSMKIGTDRIRAIVLSLRNFARLDEVDFKAIDIHEGIDNTLLILQHRLKPKPERPAIKVIRDYGNLPLVECYPGPLNQVFMNILTNAIDALEETNVQRTYSEIEEKPNQITIRTTQIDSKYITITISDNGTGMPESVQKRIFDPFFSTKAIGKGTGMGLPISYQIVTEKHRGRLEFCSHPSWGTDSIVQIPIYQRGEVAE